MTIEVDGRRASYLTAGERGPVVLLLHGTYWSRVWEPVLDRLAAAGLRPVAVDLPGLGRSEGELTAETATVPALAAWVGRFAAAIGRPGRWPWPATTSAAGSPSTCWPAGWRRCAGWRW
ncbi:alpha/beta fold hydrolase [Nonomuraea thailandensis]